MDSPNLEAELEALDHSMRLTLEVSSSTNSIFVFITSALFYSFNFFSLQFQDEEENIDNVNHQEEDEVSINPPINEWKL